MLHHILNYACLTRKALFIVKIEGAFPFSLLLKSAVTINASSLIIDEENLNGRLRFSTFIEAYNDAIFHCLLASRFELWVKKCKTAWRNNEQKRA